MDRSIPTASQLKKTADDVENARLLYNENINRLTSLIVVELEKFANTGKHECGFDALAFMQQQYPKHPRDSHKFVVIIDRIKNKLRALGFTVDGDNENLIIEWK